MVQRLAIQLNLRLGVGRWIRFELIQLIRAAVHAARWLLVCTGRLNSATRPHDHWRFLLTIVELFGGRGVVMVFSPSLFTHTHTSIHFVLTYPCHSHEVFCPVSFPVTEPNGRRVRSSGSALKGPQWAFKSNHILPVSPTPDLGLWRLTGTLNRAAEPQVSCRSRLLSHLRD